MVTVNNTPIHLSDLNDAFLAVDSAKLECDGHTLMLSHALGSVPAEGEMTP